MAVGSGVCGSTSGVTPHQVCAAFISMTNGTTGKKLSQPTVAAVNLRHSSWLCRKSTGSKIAWRPRTRFRISTVRHIAEVDNQYRVSTPTGGLVWCKPIWEHQLWSDANWRLWRAIQGTEDQAGENISGANAMLYKPELMLNYIPWWDWCHGVSNDLGGLLVQVFVQSFAR